MSIYPSRMKKNIIVSRISQLIDDEQIENILIEIEQPQSVQCNQSQSNWFCRITVTCKQQTYQEKIHGVDAFQALSLAMHTTLPYLFTQLTKINKGTIYYLDQPYDLTNNIDFGGDKKIMIKKTEEFIQMLTGGHPNSLGRTVEVVEIVMTNAHLVENLINCYYSDDEIVRLRVSNAVKRICKEKPEWLVPYIDTLIHAIAKINQASTQWTLANLFATLTPWMNKEQYNGAKEIVKHNLATHDDWIVINNSIKTLTTWAKQEIKENNTELKDWLHPQLRRHQKDPRKSIARNAEKSLALFKRN